MEDQTMIPMEQRRNPRQTKDQTPIGFPKDQPTQLVQPRAVWHQVTTRAESLKDYK